MAGLSFVGTIPKEPVVPRGDQHGVKPLPLPGAVISILEKKAVSYEPSILTCLTFTLPIGHDRGSHFRDGNAHGLLEVLFHVQ